MACDRCGSRLVRGRHNVNSGCSRHHPKSCPYLHVKKCKGCGRSCSCYRKKGKR
jgi:hypothetical protein